MRISMLGPLEVRAEGGAAVALRGARLRTLLITLALEPGQLVSTTRLVDGIWPENPPAEAVNALQALVSRLRRTLPGAPVESGPAGYRLVIEPDMVDVTRFERLVAAGRSALAEDAAGAARNLRAALGLWRGPPLLDVAGEDFFAAPVARLAELRLAAVEDRAEANFRLGRCGELIAELTSLVAEYPSRERLVGALMRALTATGRSAEALAVYERTRTALADALGADPSPELSALHTAVLRGELREHLASDVDLRLRTNLRAGLTSFVGRDVDVAQVGKLIGEYRLTTLTGPGGSGKTRLAVETARALLGQMPNGVWLIELASAGSDVEVPQTAIAALGLRGRQELNCPIPGGEPVDRLVSALRTRTALLVLDNCEHLIGATATLAERLLAECPRLRILATSREPLGVTGEALWPVEPLALPPEIPLSGEWELVETLSYPAMRLLNDRACAANPRFALTESTAPAAVRICRALDGIPLAIELAAARLRTMTVEQLAARLDDRFRLLTCGSRTALPRHRTLRAVIDWSWELLTDTERALLRRLAIFSRGATVEAAERVCGADGSLAPEDVLGLLGALADKSLLTIAERETGTRAPRYGMLETIKEYSLRRLGEAGERDRTRRAHAGYVVDLAETADPHLRGAEQLVWLDRLVAEHDNIDAALRGAIAANDAGTAVRLVAAVGWYWLFDWWICGRKAEGARLAATALSMPGAVDGEARATACVIATLFSLSGFGDEREAKNWFATARHITGRTRCRHPLLRLIAPLERMLWSTGDDSADMTDSFTDEQPWVRAVARLLRGVTLVHIGRRHTEAEADLVAALTAFRTIGDRWGISSSLRELAELLSLRGDLATAIAHREEAITVLTQMVPVKDLWMSRLRLAELRWQFGDRNGAASTVAAVERDAERISSPLAPIVLAYTKANLARWSGDSRTARTHLARIETLSRDVDLGWSFQALLLDSFGYLDTMDGDLASARAHRADALALALRSADAPTIGQILVGIADQALCQGAPDKTARLLAAGDVIRGTADRSLPDAIRLEAATRSALGEREFAEAMRRGQSTIIDTMREITANILEEP